MRHITCGDWNLPIRNYSGYSFQVAMSASDMAAMFDDMKATEPEAIAITEQDGGVYETFEGKTLNGCNYDGTLATFTFSDVDALAQALADMQDTLDMLTLQALED